MSWKTWGRVVNAGLLLALVSSGVSGCATGKRVQKFLASEQFVIPAGVRGNLGEVRVDLGDGTREIRPYAPKQMIHEGRLLEHPVEITSWGGVEIEPLKEHVTLKVWVRHTGLNRHDFLHVHTVSGGLDGRLPSEIRPLPGVLEETLSLPMRQLHNVYNGYTFWDGDLLLLELTHPDELTERYLFESRLLQWRAKAGANFLVQVPIPGRELATSVAPVFAVTVAVGYRFQTQRPALRWMGENLSVVTSLGVGSTALSEAGVGRDRVNSLLNAVLIGAGIEVYDFLSIQFMGNVSSPFRDVAEAPLTIAIGFDAVQFGRITWGASSRLFWKNTLD